MRFTLHLAFKIWFLVWEVLSYFIQGFVCNLSPLPRFTAPLLYVLRRERAFLQTEGSGNLPGACVSGTFSQQHRLTLCLCVMNLSNFFITVTFVMVISDQ